MKPYTLGSLLIIATFLGCSETSPTTPSDSLNNSRSINVTYQSALPIAGFQFRVTGVVVTQARDGVAAQHGFNVSTQNNIVIGFSFQGATIPSGQGTLLVLDIEAFGLACLEDVVFSYSGGNALNTSINICLSIVVHA